MFMYEVRYVYAPYPSVHFRKKKDAIAFCNTQVAQTKLYRETLFGWKEIEKTLDKPKGLWYNKSTKGEGKATTSVGAHESE